jgi:hypothetical protein
VALLLIVKTCMVEPPTATFPKSTGEAGATAMFGAAQVPLLPESK